MTNSAVKQFEAKVNQIVSEQKTRITTWVNEHIATFQSIDLATFSNEQPYNGEVKNKIFFTYNNHYRGNSGTWMSVGELTRPHLNYEDRGYIKGVMTDLDGYMKLQSASRLSHNFDCVYGIYYPRFRASKHSQEYKGQCDAIVSKAMAELNLFVDEQKKVLNVKLNEMTGCSLLHYLRNL